MEPSPTYDLSVWRARIPLLKRAVPMNACSHGPRLDGAREGALRYLESWGERGMEWEAWMEEVEEARATFARLVGAAPDEVAVLSSVSHATAAVASALDFAGARSRVALTEAEFPGVAHAWLAQRSRGARIDWIRLRGGRLPQESYEEVVDERTLLISACHGYYQTGYRQDLPAVVEVARRHGALVYVDAYQTVGTEQVDVKALDVDFLASGCLKYLLGVPGLAFLYVRPELAASLEPAVTGWFGRADPFAFEAARLDWSVGGRRFDGGTPPVPACYASRPGMEAILEVGPGAVRSWTRTLVDRLVRSGRERGLELLGPRNSALRTPSTAFRSPVDSHRLEARMRQKGVLTSARGPAIRLAPHFYSTPDDVDRALDVLVESVRELA